jgi:hypothetical protein
MSLLGPTSITPEEQRKNGRRHRPTVVFAVLGLIAVYIYLFTDISEILNIPTPQEAVETRGIDIPHVFDKDGNVDSKLSITFTRRFNSDDERLIYFTIVALTFLCAYFLPFRYKVPSMVLWFAIVVGILYGIQTTAGLFFAHIIVYLVLHSSSSQARWVSWVAGVLGYIAFTPTPTLFLTTIDWVRIFAVGLYFKLFYHFLILLLLKKPRIAAVLRAVIAQSAMITVCVGAILEGLNGTKWSLPLGLLLFFWQFQRLIIYHIDYKANRIPTDISIIEYFSIFLNPAVLGRLNWSPYIGQGYSYITNNFLSEDKNRLVISGLKLLTLALVYLVFGEFIVKRLASIFKDHGIMVYPYLRTLVRHYVKGTEMTTPTVLLSSMLDQLRIFLFWGGVVHFRVGVWRLYGYRIDPHFHFPILATNLVSLWGRFTFHFREFLVKAFYYPAFFRFFKNHMWLRIITATLAAATFGNLFWGHVPEMMYYKGVKFERFLMVLQIWPYYVLLGGGITVTEIYLKYTRRTRKPWSRDRWIITDVIAVYFTLQYYSLIHVFARPCTGGSLGDYTRLFLIGLGFNP